MAVGDVVNGFSELATILDFQPASGVECMIQSFGSTGVDIVPLLFDGTNSSSFATTHPTLSNGVSNINIKVIINNTNYLRLPAAAAQYTFYTGVTTK